MKNVIFVSRNFYIDHYLTGSKSDGIVNNGNETSGRVINLLVSPPTVRGQSASVPPKMVSIVLPSLGSSNQQGCASGQCNRRPSLLATQSSWDVAVGHGSDTGV